MPKFKVADFYYGAVLSMLFNNNITPALVEGNNDRQIYDFTTDNGNFRLFIKYRSKGRLGSDGEYRSWQFTFTAGDLDEISKYLVEERHFRLALVCGEERLDDSELAILTPEEIEQCLGNGKTSLTISRARGEKAFRISIGGGRDNSIKIPSKRLVG